jgi:hypothetical protein
MIPLLHADLDIPRGIWVGWSIVRRPRGKWMKTSLLDSEAWSTLWYKIVDERTFFYKRVVHVRCTRAFTPKVSPYRQPIFSSWAIAYETFVELVFSRPIHTGPKSHMVNLCNLNRWEHGSWDLPCHTGSQVPRSKYDMDGYMATLFRGEAWDLCCKLGWAKSYTQLSTRVLQIFVHKIIKILLEWYLTYFNGLLRLKSWDFATMSGLANMSETWKPVWTGPHVCLANLQE